MHVAFKCYILCVWGGGGGSGNERPDKFVTIWVMKHSPREAPKTRGVGDGDFGSYFFHLCVSFSFLLFHGGSKLPSANLEKKVTATTRNVGDRHVLVHALGEMHDASCSVSRHCTR